MKIFKIETELWVPKAKDIVFDFFSDARNLNQLTPPLLEFKIVTPDPIIMAVGTLIDYKLKIRGIPVNWQSEITTWDKPHNFVDQQRKGPYRHWVHQHQFIEKDGGTLVKDQVDYSVFGGALINKFFVAKDLQNIFDYRKKELQNIFE